MKRSGTFLAAIMVLFLPLLARGAGTNPWEHKLPFKNATITYALSGDEMGTETLYIRKYGKEMAAYRDSKNAIGLRRETVTIMTPDWIYNFDVLKKTGTKSSNPQKYMLKEYNKLSGSEKKEVARNARNMGNSMTKRLHGTIEMNAKKILGYECDKATIRDTTVYSIHDTGLPLKSESSMNGVSLKKEAMKIDNGPIDAKYFKFPKGIAPRMDKRGELIAQIIANKTIEMLKSPLAPTPQQSASGHSGAAKAAGGAAGK